MRWTRITERLVDGVAVLDLEAQSMGMDHEGQLAGKIDELLHQGHSKILLNLARLSYMDSDGLARVIQGYKIAKEAGATVKLCVHPKISNLLHDSRLDTFLEAYESEPEAIRSFGSSEGAGEPS